MLGVGVGCGLSVGGSAVGVAGKQVHNVSVVCQAIST